MSEVLELVVDPWTLVKRVATKLKPGALVLASFPNVTQTALLRGLIADRRELTDEGMNCQTHLRWFTKGSYRKMFEDTAIQVARMETMSQTGRVGKLFNLIKLNRFRHLTMVQICDGSRFVMPLTSGGR